MVEVLLDFPIHIPLLEAHRYMGFPLGFDIPKQIARMIDEEVALAADLITPKATYYTMDYDKNNNVVYNKEDNLNLCGASINNHLVNCTQATLFTCTIGPNLDTLIDTCFKTGEFTKALVLDAIGSAAVEYVADTLNQYLSTAAYRQRYSLVSRFSPGYGGWDLAIQKDLVALAGGSAIGITVTDTSLLIPRKSVSGVIGWQPGLNLNVNTPPPCELCQIRKCKNPICKGGVSQ